jgi:hypothetical protein
MNAPQKIKSIQSQIAASQTLRLCDWPTQTCEASLSFTLSRFSDSLDLLRPRRLGLDPLIAWNGVGKLHFFEIARGR